MKLWRRTVRAAFPAAVVAGVIATILFFVDNMFFLPRGPIGWHDGYGNPTPPNIGELLWAKPHLTGIAMGFILAAAFLGTLAGFLSEWTPDDSPLLPTEDRPFGENGDAEE